MPQLQNLRFILMSMPHDLDACTVSGFDIDLFAALLVRQRKKGTLQIPVFSSAQELGGPRRAPGWALAPYLTLAAESPMEPQL